MSGIGVEYLESSSTDEERVVEVDLTAMMELDRLSRECDREGEKAGCEGSAMGEASRDLEWWDRLALFRALVAMSLVRASSARRSLI